jgi:hypothetical protein
VRTSGSYPKQNAAWSRDDEDQLAAMREAGTHISKIASTLGRTQASCESRLQKIKKQHTASVSTADVTTPG